MRREIYNHKQPCTFILSYFNFSVCWQPQFKKKLTNNLRLRILDALSIIYYPEKWCERKETFRQLISNIKHVNVVNLQNHVQLRLSLRLL